MPSPIIQTLFYRDNLSILRECFSIDMPKSVPGQFKQAEKVRKKEGKQGELGI